MEGAGRGGRSKKPETPPGPANAAVLYLVATPIGNLEDITLRALRVLRDVAVVAAEDTRRTRQLLQHYQIPTRLVSVHAHNEGLRTTVIGNLLRNGQSVALVSDAGTPGISDPGAAIVAFARTHGFRVEPIPGASAVTAAMSVSGTPGERFVFAGFPPVKSKDRILWLDWLVQQPDPVPIVCFEAPHRLAQTLAELEERLPGRPILVGREVTKRHEEWRLLERPTAGVQPALLERGEFVLVLGPAMPAPGAPVTDDEVRRVFGQITDLEAGSRREAVKQTAERLGVSPRFVYASLERTKQPLG